MKPLSNLQLSICLCVFVVIFSPAHGLATEPEEEPRLPLAMEVFLKKPKTRVYELHIHLTNVSQDRVSVNVRDLPWNPPNDSKWIFALRMDGQDSPVKQRVQGWEFGSRVIQLVPGESIQDTMVLNPRMPSLLADIAQFGVKLHWDCPPAAVKFVCQQNSPHSLTIPKGDPGHPDVYSQNQDTCQKLKQAIGFIKIPDGHEVIFLLTSETVMTDIQEVQDLLYRVDDYVQQCHPSWTNSWAVNFFTKERYAGFLGDKENKHFFEQGIWQQVNIGQYSSQTRTLSRFPWIKDKSDSVYLSVFR